jgi:hypothetical protein
MPSTVTVTEHSSVEDMKGRWASIVLALEPLTETLPEPYRSFFESPIKLLIGNKISLAIIPPRHMWSYLEQIEEIYNNLKNIDYLGYDLDHVLLKMSSLLSRLGLSMSIEGKFLLEGPMSQQTQTTRQTAEYLGPEVIQRSAS